MMGETPNRKGPHPMPAKAFDRPPGAQLPAKGVDVLTPPSLLEALGALRRHRGGGWALGPDPFDLDPAASERAPWPTARTHYTVHEDGTAHPWEGEAWLNAPYGNELYHWLARLADHGNGLALLYARTDTRGFHAHVWGRADAVFFFEGRLFFHEPVTGYQMPWNCGGPVVLAAYGPKSAARLERLTRPGSPYPGRLVPVTHTKRRK
jgi:hypothetical protein